MFKKVNVYYRIHKFFSDNNFSYLLQIGFTPKFLTVHALSSLTESTRQTVDEVYTGFGVFVGLQKALYTVKHDILLSNKRMVHAIYSLYFLPNITR